MGQFGDFFEKLKLVVIKCYQTGHFTTVGAFLVKVVLLQSALFGKYSFTSVGAF